MAIIDNSGGLIAECVNVLRNKSNHGLARVGTYSILSCPLLVGFCLTIG